MPSTSALLCRPVTNLTALFDLWFILSQPLRLQIRSHPLHSSSKAPYHLQCLRCTSILPTAHASTLHSNNNKPLGHSQNSSQSLYNLASSLSYPSPFRVLRFYSSFRAQFRCHRPQEVNLPYPCPAFHSRVSASVGSPHPIVLIATNHLYHLHWNHLCALSNKIKQPVRRTEQKPYTRSS